jgi:hypothetical protein
MPSRARTPLRAHDVAAVLVTRGDVDLTPILDTLPYDEVVIWDNSRRSRDLAAYGRYEAIKEARAEVIYFQDDDCLVTCHERLLGAYEDGKLLANMPARRLDYTDTVLVGWGSLFRRDLPERAFARYADRYPTDDEQFRRIGADFIFPMLTPWKRVDFGFQDLPYHDSWGRTFQQAGYDSTKAEFLRRGRELRPRPPRQRHYYFARKIAVYAVDRFLPGRGHMPAAATANDRSHDVE